MPDEEHINEEMVDSVPVDEEVEHEEGLPEEIEVPQEGEQVYDTEAYADHEGEYEEAPEEHYEEPVEEHYEEPVEEHHEEPHHEHVEEHITEDTGLSPITEREELKAAIALIEYKLTEINALIRECIEQEFAADIMSESQTLMLACTGLTYQIIFHNFKQGMRRVKVIFLDLLKQKMKNLDEEYDDEIDFFLDTFEDFVDKDYKLAESLEISKKYVKYYVSPRFYDSLISIAEPEIRAMNAIHTRLKVSRKEVQDLIVKKMIERENYLKELHEHQEAVAEHEEHHEDHHAPSFDMDHEPEYEEEYDDSQGDYEEEIPEKEYDEEEPEEEGEDYGVSNSDAYDEEYGHEGGDEHGDQHDDMIEGHGGDGYHEDMDDEEFDEMNTGDGS